MARGWESKSVEGQVEEFQEKDGAGHNRQMTPAEAEAWRHREILLLSRARVQKDLELARNPRYREQLSRALADLDVQIAALDKADGDHR